MRLPKERIAQKSNLTVCGDQIKTTQFQLMLSLFWLM